MATTATASAYPTTPTDPNAQVMAAAQRARATPKPRPAAPLTLAPDTSVPAATSAEAPAAPANGQVQAPDRLSLADDAITSSAKATDPYYQKALRDATSQAASVGQLGSGQLRTSLGDLARNRALELDTLRSNTINTALNNAIEDQFRARDQGLAASQLELSGELGHGNLDVAKQQADTARLGTTGNLALGQGQLELAKTGQENQASQFTQSLDFQKEQASIEAAYKAGTLTLAQRDQALRELAQSQDNAIAQGQLELAKTGQENQASQFTQSLDFQKEQAKIEAAYKAGTLTLAQRDQALRELAQSQDNAIAQGQLSLAQTAQSQGNQIAQGQLALAQTAQAQNNAIAQGQLSLAQTGQTADIALRQKALDAQTAYQNGQLTLAQRDQALKELAESHGWTIEQAKLDLSKQQLDQAAKQFGLSLDQQKALAEMADKTQNKQIDVSSEQGRNALLVQLANILGGPSGNVNPAFLSQVLKALGLVKSDGSSTSTDGLTNQITAYNPYNFPTVPTAPPSGE